MIPSRLDKYLSDATAMSRSQIRRAWERDEIEVRLAEGAGASGVDLGTLIFAEDEVLWRGERVEPRRPSTYVALHKPAGVLSDARAREGGRETLAPWLEALDPGIFPVGRLDLETSGLMLLTDDGDLAHMLTRPDSGLVYEYHLRLQGRLDPSDASLRRLLEGVELKPGERSSVISLEVVAGGVDVTHVRLFVDESRSRQLRSMCHVAEVGLEGLCRLSIGPVSMGALEPGQSRELARDEVDALWARCGGRELVARRRREALERLARRRREQGEPHLRLEAWLDQA